MRTARRIFLVFLFTYLAIGASQVFSGEQSEEKLAITHGPYLQHVTENSIIIIWFTNKKCVSKVEYGTGDNFRTFPQWGSLLQIAQSSRHGLIDAYTTHHKVQITGLEPGKAYRYRVSSKEILQFEPYEVIFGETVVSDIFGFKTLDPAKKNFLFYVFQDIHGDAKRLDSMLQKIRLDDVDMIIFNGDTLNYLTSEKPIFEGFLDVSVDRFAKEIPFLYVRGNHDTRGSFARQLMDFFPPRDGKYYYSFKHGPVHFVVMDTGEDKPDTHPVYAGLTDFDRYRELQEEWLKKEIQSESFKKALYRVAVFHIPPFRKRHGSSEIARLWMPLLNEGGFDLLLCGHNHRFSRTNPTKGKNTFPILVAPPRGFVKVDVSENQINLAVVNMGGETLDSFTVLPKKRN